MSAVDELFDHTSMVFREAALGSLYASLILGAYTAFEVLATDLWVEAVNARPRTLAMNALVPAGKLSAGDEDAKGFNQPATMRLADLTDYGFDLSDKMGHLLRDRRRAKFDSLDGIQLAYKAAFRTDEEREAKRSGSAVGALIAARFADVAVLQAVRNLVAHHGGIVDGTFLSEVGGHDPVLGAAVKSTRLHPDGQLVSKLVLAAIRLSAELLRFVDDWLRNNPDGKPDRRTTGADADT